MSLSRKRWGSPLPAPLEDVTALAEALDVLPAVARVLHHRGMASAGDARAFIRPSLERLHSPWLMKGMQRAVERIGVALDRGEKIVVYGDYDVDGITAAALLIEALRRLGAAGAGFYLPSRFREGYGLHREALERIAAQGAALVITVDCGTNASAEAACARGLGLDLIVTDHHQPFAALDGAVAVLNPLQEDCPYPFKALSGAGIAFKLATALMERGGLPFPEHLLDLAALGTVADMVPLLGENRILAVFGLDQLRRSSRAGLRALAAAGGLELEQVDSYALAFALAPPLNAAGRLGEADPAIRLLLEGEAAEAERLAQFLHQSNRQRRETGARILEEAEAILERDRPGAGEHVITLAGAGWPHGVIGIAASRLAERFYRPVVLIGLEGAEGRGSARSIPGFDITAALHSCAPLLERLGGHEQAAGLTIRADRVDELRESLNRYAAPRLPEERLSPLLEFDAVLEPREIGLDLARQLEVLEPFGAGNPPPLFCGRDWELRSWSLVGSGQKHLKLNLSRREHTAAPIFFSGAALEPFMGRGRRFDLAFTLREGHFAGRPVLNMVLKDLRRSDRFSGGRVTVIDRRGQDNRLAALKRLLRTGEAAAVFVGTKRRKEALRQRLPAELQLDFMSSGGDNRGGGRLAPAAAVGRRTLLLHDLPLAPRMLEPFFASCAGGAGVRIALLYSGADRERNDLLLDLALPSRRALVEIYRSWSETAAAGQGGTFPGELRQTYALPVGDRYWERCLKIFAEAGLCPEGRPRALGSPAELGRSLDASPSFRAALELRESCLRFQEMLLEATPAELAAGWEKLLPE